MITSATLARCMAFVVQGLVQGLITLLPITHMLTHQVCITAFSGLLRLCSDLLAGQSL